MSDTFDFVVVGGGSGGCAVAGRLWGQEAAAALRGRDVVAVQAVPP